MSLLYTAASVGSVMSAAAAILLYVLTSKCDDVLAFSSLFLPYCDNALLMSHDNLAFQ